MSTDPQEYVLDCEYEDRKEKSNPNEFTRWLGIKNAGGMRPIYRRKRQEKGISARDLAALVLVSRDIQGARYNPWEDIVERDQGRIWYWGDAKAHKTKTRDQWDGNRFLAQIWNLIGRQQWKEVPPILHFSKRRSGTVHFNGLCVLADLQDAWFEDDGQRVQNYRAVLDIIPVPRVSLEWINSRRDGHETRCPDVWSIYARSGERQRLKLHTARVRANADQLPDKGSPGWYVLEELHGLPPIRFEELVVRAFSESEVVHDITPTSPARDGGFDFFGSFRLPPPLGYEVPIKGEVKRYAPGKTAVGPKDVSRLVARLQRGQHGVFVTTSYFTRQAQEEVLEDRYPVELISGDRLVGMLQHLGATAGSGLKPAWRGSLQA